MINFFSGYGTVLRRQNISALPLLCLHVILFAAISLFTGFYDLFLLLRFLVFALVTLLLDSVHILSLYNLTQTLGLVRGAVLSN